MSQIGLRLPVQRQARRRDHPDPAQPLRPAGAEQPPERRGDPHLPACERALHLQHRAATRPVEGHRGGQQAAARYPRHRAVQVGRQLRQRQRGPGRLRPRLRHRRQAGPAAGLGDQHGAVLRRQPASAARLREPAHRLQPAAGAGLRRRRLRGDHADELRHPPRAARRQGHQGRLRDVPDPRRSAPGRDAVGQGAAPAHPPDRVGIVRQQPARGERLPRRQPRRLHAHRAHERRRGQPHRALQPARLSGRERQLQPGERRRPAGVHEPAARFRHADHPGQRGRRARRSSTGGRSERSRTAAAGFRCRTWIPDSTSSRSWPPVSGPMSAASSSSPGRPRGSRPARPTSEQGGRRRPCSTCAFRASAGRDRTGPAQPTFVVVERALARATIDA